MFIKKPKELAKPLAYLKKSKYEKTSDYHNKKQQMQVFVYRNEKNFVSKTCQITFYYNKARVKPKLRMLYTVRKITFSAAE